MLVGGDSEASLSTTPEQEAVEEAWDRVGEKHLRIQKQVAKACAGEAHLFLNGFQASRMSEKLSKCGIFSHPGRRRGSGLRCDLDGYRCRCHSEGCSPFLRGDPLGRTPRQVVNVRADRALPRV
jgi:hypothetical protein